MGRFRSVYDFIDSVVLGEVRGQRAALYMH